MEYHQINLTGQEIDERLQNVGTPEDVAAADGTLYARISKNADDISTLQKAVGDNVRIDALDNGDASASFVAGRNLKVNGWEFYWKDVWEESEPSAIKHIESAGVNAAINEIKGTGADVSAFTFPTTKDEFIAYLKTITFDFSNQPNQVSGYGSVTYGIMNKNAGTTTIVEGMRNAVPNKIHRSHIEGQYMTFPDVEYALDCHVEGQDCNIVGYASICHLEGTGSAVVHSMRENVGFFSEAVGCHVEGGGGVAGGAYSHVEGSGCAALNFGAHCEGRGYYKNSVTDWKKRTAKDNDYLKDLWKKILFGKTDTSGYTYKFSAAIGHASHVEGMSNLTPTCFATLEGLDEGTTASFVNGANHAEGAGNLAGAVASHAEGIRNEIGDNAYASHAEGIKNITQNRAEHASGQYNKSNKATDTFGDSGNTLFSVGCGTSDADRKNAFEVMQDGTCKYYDVATGEQINVGVAKELSKPFDLTIGSTTKKVNGKSVVTFTAEEIGGASPMVAARLRLGVNKTGQHFRIHGKGLLPTDEVRLYRNVHSISHWDDSPDGTSKSKIKRKGWREVKYLGQGENYIAFPYLELATDVMENSPLANEVNVLVRVKQNGQDVYTGELIDFFVDYYLYLGTGHNHDKKDALYIRNGRKTKKVEVDSTGEYFSTARTVDWAVLVLRDGKPITDFMPFKWLVETEIGISAPMDIQACIDDTLKVSAVPYNHYAGNGASKTVELPNLDVVTSVGTVRSDLNSVSIEFNTRNLADASRKSYAYVNLDVVNKTSGVMSPQMLLHLNDLYADHIQRKYRGQNVVVLGTGGNYRQDSIPFNGSTYQKADVRVGNSDVFVFDLGEKKTINNTLAAEQTFMSFVRDIWYLPEGITNYDDAFRSSRDSSNDSLDVHCHIDMSQCTSAVRMFFQRRGLKSLDVSGWDVSKMKNFSYMFALTGLEKLDVSKWDVSSAENLVSIFTGSRLETIDTSKWNTASATSLRSLFQALLVRKIDVSQFDTSKVTDMGWMFYTWGLNVSDYTPARNKEIVGLTNFNTSKVTDFSNMFAGLGNVTLDLSSFSLESAEKVDAMFSVDVAANMSQHVTLGKNFFNAPKISSLELSNLKMSAELKQSLINCFDRKAAGQQTLTLSLPIKMLSGVTALTEEEKAAIKAKGYELA